MVGIIDCGCEIIIVEVTNSERRICTFKSEHALYQQESDTVSSRAFIFHLIKPCPKLIKPQFVIWAGIA
jgi:hypothetical protein